MTPTASTVETAPRVEHFPRSRPWRLEGDKLHLIGIKCAQCGLKAFPAREVCSGCASEDVSEVELAASGRLYSFSEVHVAPKGFATPYVVAYVDLDDGVRLFGQIEGRASDLSIDQTVMVVPGVIRTRADGTEVLSYKFRGQST